jgi:hypothetical protein
MRRQSPQSIGKKHGMNDVPDTELFSAYLDGELTANEQVRVEQMLAASVEARQLVEELRALGNTLQCLPHQKLDEDLTARILQAAERRMLLPGDSGNQPSAGRAAEALTESDADSTGWLGIPWRGMFSKRALIWLAVVVVTAIIINFNSPPKPKQNQFARLEEKAAPGTAAAPAGEQAKRSTSNLSWDAPAGQRSPARDDRTTADDVRDENVRERDKLAAARTWSDHDNFSERETESPARRMRKADVGELAMDFPSEKAKGYGMPGKAAHSLAEEQVVRAEEKRLPSPNKPLAESKPATVAAGMSAGPAAAVPSHPPEVAMAYTPKSAAEPSSPVAAPEPPVISKGGGGGKPASAQRRPGKAASGSVDIANQSPAKGGETTQRMNGPEFALSNADLAPEGGKVAGNWKDGSAPANRVEGQKATAATLVRVDVSALAVQNKVFEKLLAAHGLRGDQNLRNAAQGSPSGNVSVRSGQIGQVAQNAGQGMNKQPMPKPGTYFDFDASPEQLATIIKQIGESPDSFSTPEVSPSPAMDLLAQNSVHGSGNYRGGAKMSGGELADRQAQTQKAGTEAVKSDLLRGDMAPSQPAPALVAATAAPTASPASGAAKLHVVFVLNVVDHLPPATRRSSQLTTTPAAPPPAKQ